MTSLGAELVIKFQLAASKCGHHSPSSPQGHNLFPSLPQNPVSSSGHGWAANKPVTDSTPPPPPASKQYWISKSLDYMQGEELPGRDPRGRGYVSQGLGLQWGLLGQFQVLLH